VVVTHDMIRQWLSSQLLQRPHVSCCDEAGPAANAKLGHLRSYFPASEDKQISKLEVSSIALEPPIIERLYSAPPQHEE